MRRFHRREFLFLAAACAAAAGVASAANIPRPAPELTITLVNGQQLPLSKFKGKVIALEFLLTTCPHCKQASAALEKLSGEYGPKGFQPLGAAFNDMAAMFVPDYVREVGATFPVGVAPRDKVISFIQHPMNQMLYTPVLLFIDRKFNIRAQYTGTDDFFQNEDANMRAMIEKLLAEAPAGKAKRK